MNLMHHRINIAGSADALAASALLAYARDERNGELLALKRRISELEAAVAAAAKNEERLLIEAQEGSERAGKMHARISELLRENDALFNQVESYEDIGLSFRGRIAVMSGPTALEQHIDEIAQEAA
ncbi:MAG: hypothetical protein KBE22_00060 [Candidatus Accumulibacter sp.]|nr:hypothetical protein [Accumulibacter sp.]